MLRPAAAVRRSRAPVVVAMALAALASGPRRAAGENADEPLTLARALAGGDTTIALRYRFEQVDDDAFERAAQASTLRTTLAYRSRPFRGLSLFLEAENVAEVGFDNRYDNRGAGSLANGVGDRPAIADPALTALAQASLRLERGRTRLELGRQALAVGDQRFLGPVGWRQHHQTFDALSVVDRSLERLTLTYAFVDRVHRIFGDGKPMASHLLNAAVDLRWATLTLYGLALDYDRAADAALSTATYGVELQGERALGRVTLRYELEAARQADHGANPAEVDAGYRYLRLGAGFAGLTVDAAVEVLEGGPRGRFVTPLATLHKWNGWADRFLSTPPDGLEDRYLQLTGKGLGGSLSWTAAYHDFAAEHGSADYGRELDLLVTFDTAWKQRFGLKLARYRAQDFAADSDKWWFFTTYTF